MGAQPFRSSLQPPPNVEMSTRRRHAMGPRWTRNRGRGMTALAAAALFAAGVVGAGGQAGAAPGAQKAQTIRSGAGPGWPRTLRPSDFVRHVDNRWFPLKPGSRWRYRGIDEDGRFSDVMRVTHRT